MNGIIITTNNKSDLKLITDLANRIGVRIKSVNNEELLDLGLLKAMDEGHETDFAPTEGVMEKLQKITLSC